MGRKEKRMKIDIAKDDLWWIRDILSKAVESMESRPNPPSHGKAPQIARKVIRKLNKAMKKSFGHDCYSEWYNC